MTCRPVVLLCVLTACAGRPATTGSRDASRTGQDAGDPADAAALDVADAAPADVSTDLDAPTHDSGERPDSTTAAEDAAPVHDAARAEDAPTAEDARDSADAGSSEDAGPPEDARPPEDAGPPEDARPPEDAGPSEDAGSALVVRIMAANLSSGTAQSYDPGEGLRIIQGLHPDVVLIQEFNVGDNSAAAAQSFVQTACGAACVYAREPAFAGQIPNGVISRFPIVDSGAWADSSISNRSYVWARLDVPGERDLWAVSVHLKAGSTSIDQRTAEAEELVGYLDAAVPAADLLVVGGDLNTYYPDAVREPALGALASVVVTQPLPDDGTGNTGTSANRLEPTSLRQPYDHVLPDPDLDALSVPVRVGDQTFVDGLVFDSRVFTPLSDVAPVLATDSAALNMQHMAVVRDFALAP